MSILTKAFTVYIWIGITVLILLLNRIARFYQMTTGVRSHHRVFLFPVLFFAAATMRYLVTDCRFAGDVIGDLLFFVAGICLSFMGYFLLKLMTGGR
jgi:hypothetical protein